MSESFGTVGALPSHSRMTTDGSYHSTHSDLNGKSPATGRSRAQSVGTAMKFGTEVNPSPPSTDSLNDLRKPDSDGSLNQGNLPAVVPRPRSNLGGGSRPLSVNLPLTLKAVEAFKSAGRPGSAAGTMDKKFYEGPTVSIHTVDEREGSHCAEWINDALHPEEDPELEYLFKDKRPLPTTPGKECDDALLSAIKDGVLLAKLINVTRPGTIDMKQLRRSGQRAYQSENVQIMLQGAKTIGVRLANIGTDDIIKGTPHLCISLIRQIVKLGLLSRVNIENNPALNQLLSDNEKNTKITNETLLSKWVNFHLQVAGTPRRLTNFNADLRDAEIYGTLINHLVVSGSPHEKQIQLLFAEFRKQDVSGKCETVLAMAKVLGIKCMISTEDILRGNKDNNIEFCAQLLDKFPNLEESLAKHTEATDINITSLTTKIEVSQQEISQLSEKFNRVTSDNAALQKSLADMQKKHDDLAQKSSGTEATLRKDSMGLQERLAASEKERNKFKELLAELGTMIQASRFVPVSGSATEPGVVKQHLQSLISKFSETVTDLNQEKERGETLKAQYRDVTEGTLQDTTKALTNLQTERNQLKQDLVNAEKELQTRETKLQQLVSENAQLNEQVVNTTKQLAIKNDVEIPALKVIGSDFEKKLLSAEAKIARLEQDLQTKEQNFKTESSVKDSKIAEMGRVTEGLKNEVKKQLEQEKLLTQKVVSLDKQLSDKGHELSNHDTVHEARIKTFESDLKIRDAEIARLERRLTEVQQDAKTKEQAFEAKSRSIQTDVGSANSALLKASQDIAELCKEKASLENQLSKLVDHEMPHLNRELAETKRQLDEKSTELKAKEQTLETTRTTLHNDLAARDTRIQELARLTEILKHDQAKGQEVERKWSNAIENDIPGLKSRIVQLETQLHAKVTEVDNWKNTCNILKGDANKRSLRSLDASTGPESLVARLKETSKTAQAIKDIVEQNRTVSRQIHKQPRDSEQTLQMHVDAVLSSSQRLESALKNIYHK